MTVLHRLGALVGVALTITGCSTGAGYGPSGSLDTARVAADLNRHLEAAWWEQITSESDPVAPGSPSARIVTYSVPNDVLFPSGSATVGTDGREVLQRLVRDQLQEALAVRIVGHTDSVGRDEDNELLGARRAEATRQVLLDEGLAEVPVDTASEGEREPIVEESGPDPEAARALNRRIEIVVTIKQ